MSINPHDLAELIRVNRVEWAKLDGEARYQEEMLKIKEAEIFNRSEGPMEARKMKARASQEYLSHIKSMTETRTKANIAFAEFRGLETKWETWRTLNATRRAEMKIN